MLTKIRPAISFLDTPVRHCELYPTLSQKTDHEDLN